MININEFVKKFNLAAVEMLNQKMTTESTFINMISNPEKESFFMTDTGVIAFLIETVNMAILNYPLMIRNEVDTVQFSKDIYDTIEKVIPNAMQLFKSICKNAGLLHIVSKAQEKENS